MTKTERYISRATQLLTEVALTKTPGWDQVIPEKFLDVVPIPDEMENCEQVVTDILDGLVAAGLYTKDLGSPPCWESTYVFTRVSSYPQLTAEELGSLSYFWLEKGDLERYTLWEKLQPSLKEHHPEIPKAWSKYKKAESRLNRLFLTLES